LPETLAGEPGETISVPITLDDATGVLGYYVALAYDPAYLEFTSADNGELAQGWDAAATNVQGSRIRVANAGATELAGSGTILVLHFTVKASLSAAPGPVLHFTDAELNDGTIAVTTIGPTLHSDEDDRDGSPGCFSGRLADEDGTQTGDRGDTRGDVLMLAITLLCWMLSPSHVGKRRGAVGRCVSGGQRP
jgi:hypothetical protein